MKYQLRVALRWQRTAWQILVLVLLSMGGNSLATGQIVMKGSGRYLSKEGKLLHSGTVESISSEKIDLKYQEQIHSFIINGKTKICVNGYQTNSWRRLVNAKEATIATDSNSNIALEIYDSMLGFALMMEIPFPVKFSCNAKAEKQAKKNNQNQKLSPTKTKQGKSIAEIIVENANLRESPNISSETIRTVALGEKLVLRDSQPISAWYKVFDAETGQEGWLHGNTFKIVTVSKSKPSK